MQINEDPSTGLFGGEERGGVGGGEGNFKAGEGTGQSVSGKVSGSMRREMEGTEAGLTFLFSHILAATSGLDHEACGLPVDEGHLHFLLFFPLLFPHIVVGCSFPPPHLNLPLPQGLRQILGGHWQHVTGGEGEVTFPACPATVESITECGWPRCCCSSCGRGPSSCRTCCSVDAGSRALAKRGSGRPGKYQEGCGQARQQ